MKDACNKNKCNKKKAEIKCTNVKAPTIKQQNDGDSFSDSMFTNINANVIQPDFHWRNLWKYIARFDENKRQREE